MNTLTDYFEPFQLEAAWTFGPRVLFRAAGGPGNPFHWDVRGDPSDLMMDGIDDDGRATTLMQILTLWRFMKRGPAIVRPGADLGRALMDTEIRVPSTAYRQPYEVMGVELPREVAGPHHLCLEPWSWHHRPGNPDD